MADPVFADLDASGGVERALQPLASAFLIILSLPLNAYAVQVGCFVTAVLLGCMFLLSLGITLLLKAQLSCRVGGASKTPWKCMLFLTAGELFLFVLVFAVTQTGFLATLAIYLPFAAVLNGFVLKRPLQALAAVASPRKRWLLYVLLALSLPAAIQLAGLVWSALTGFLESTEFHA